MSCILGINAFHADASACLVEDGRPVAAVEEERFRRVKHWAGFPEQSIRYCLEAAKISIGDLDTVAINTDPRAARIHKLKYVLSGKPGLGLIREKLRVRKRREGIGALFGRAFGTVVPDEKIVYVEHHKAHLAGAFFLSPFESAAILSLDGFGDFCSTAWGKAGDEGLDIEGRILFPHSLGVFYQAMTQFLGFPRYGDEYKVMGLASYGVPAYEAEVSRLLSSTGQEGFRLNLDYFRHHRHRIGYEWEGGEPFVDALFDDELENLLGPPRTPDMPITQRHKDIARSTQDVYEQAVHGLLNHLHDRYGTDDLVLAGGCAMNSVANGKICIATPFRRVHVHPAAGDAGGAVGAALAAHDQLDGRAGRFTIDKPYLGPGFDGVYIERLLQERRAELLEAGCEVQNVPDDQALIAKTVSALVHGKVVGWFQGRMEWGPRALGNRSILCDPRREDAKELLNDKIKRRESFRPFAPSILREAVEDWFIQDGDVPFMERVFEIRPSMRERIPAVTHVDGTGRLQTVTREANPRYHDLISVFGAETGVPMLLNTSFNENEPIVCRPEEALECFLRTKMDVLVLEDYVVQRLPEEAH